MSVREGMDTARVQEIAGRVDTESERLSQIQQDGTVMMSVLAQSWAGPDLGHFHDSWMSSAPQLEAMAATLRAVAKELQVQAQQQLDGSDGSLTGGGGGATRTGGGDIPWGDVRDFGQGLLIPDQGMRDKALDFAHRTARGVDKGVDLARDEVEERVDQVREGMDWLGDRAEDVADWTQDRALELAGIAASTADALLFTGVSALVGRALYEHVKFRGWWDDGHGEAGEIVELADGAIAEDSNGGEHVPVKPPTSLEKVMLSTTDAYDNDGHVRITTVTKADGSTAYIVNTPGTEEWVPGSDNPLDTTGNLRTINGDSSAGTEAVWDAMEKAGIPPGAPVLMAGHSQGGMINQALMSDPRFMERFSVTHAVSYGSPVDSMPDTSGVRQLHLQHEGDVVPRVDLGNAPKPTRLGDDATVVTLDNPPGVYEVPWSKQAGLGQPLVRPDQMPQVPFTMTEDIKGAHSHENYADSVSKSKDPQIDSFESDLDDFLVSKGDGSTVKGVDVEVRRK